VVLDDLPDLGIDVAAVEPDLALEGDEQTSVVLAVGHVGLDLLDGVGQVGAVAVGAVAQDHSVGIGFEQHLDQVIGIDGGVPDQLEGAVTGAGAAVDVGVEVDFLGLVFLLGVPLGQLGGRFDRGGCVVEGDGFVVGAAEAEESGQGQDDQETIHGFPPQ